tara:strand:- start:101 stop:442 length:342 start_codon:yes stop_codon:yes gene_type:complete
MVAASRGANKSVCLPDIRRLGDDFSPEFSKNFFLLQIVRQGADLWKTRIPYPKIFNPAVPIPPAALLRSRCETLMPKLVEMIRVLAGVKKNSKSAVMPNDPSQGCRANGFRIL